MPEVPNRVLQDDRHLYVFGYRASSRERSQKLGQAATLVLVQTTLHDDQEIYVAPCAVEGPGGQGAVEVHACQPEAQNFLEAAHRGLDMLSDVSVQRDLPAGLYGSLLRFACCNRGPATPAALALHGAGW